MRSAVRVFRKNRFPTGLRLSSTASSARQGIALSVGKYNKYNKNGTNGSWKSSRKSTTYGGAFLVASAVAIAFSSQITQSLENGVKVDMGKPSVSPAEVVKHSSPDDCWVVIDGYVYNLTEFIGAHPGGPAIIKNNAGKDVTKIFAPIHAPDVIEKYIAPKNRLGPLEGTMPEDRICAALTPGETAEDVARKEQLRQLLPDVNNLTNLYDFEFLASQILTKQAWSYYSSAADDEVTQRENHAAYHRIFFKPRILVNVKEVDTSTTMLGEKVGVPFYVSATALCKLGNPQEGEKDIARGCGESDAKPVQMISTLASCSLQEIVEAAPSKEQIQWFQLYVNSDRKITDDLVKNAEKLGLKAIFVTVDAPSLGNREKDAKVKFTNSNGAKAMEKSNVDESKGASRALSSFIDPALNWDDIVELKTKTKLPIVIKGVQCVEDVLKAAEVGAAGVVLSNHGGRQLDFSRAPIEVLAETMPALREKKLDDKLEVFIDGGVRRGTDILKALCLGAKGVGLGRPFLYSNSCYGKEGVKKAIELLKDELEMSMRLLGVTSIDQLSEKYLDLSTIHGRTVSVPRDNIYRDVYVAQEPSQFRED
ncbi:unnamed protein product [Kluyveromyces dobzhanskii CBS 2104]|uniref:L-lactate dehydrogenase (cytochrome) n=1 Tax=Kluyveromyces dobzhanskii CBS 2104 TaxID=1427455 RepID=A0A0A8L3M9_9SACH|nr:unnamed protein product [Kluyveromyces dobzhanskii CBS 2104]